MRYYFDTPIGCVECEVTAYNAITSCKPISEVEQCSLEESEYEHPKLAQALRVVDTCPEGYTLEPGYTPEFSLNFWRVLASIPRGTSITYGEFTHKLGLRRGYARVVGQALGKNSCFILLPCHRVVSAGGGLGSFRWGVEVKKRLLEYEAR